MRTGQDIKEVLGPIAADLGEGGGGVRVQVRARMQPDQPKRRAASAGSC